ncbi:baseplate J/gp47 family protein [Ursidibacter arcticus]
MLIVPTLEQIRSTILRDIQSLNPRADIAEDSDNYARASSLAAVAEGLYAYQKWIIKQFFPDTADTEFLEKHAGLRGIRRKNATYASGAGATVYGQDGSQIGLGLQITTQDGRFYEVIEPNVIRNGSAVVVVRSLATGVKQNISQETTASFMSAPVGVQSDCVLNHIVGGTDAESDVSLLARLLEHIRRPPAGGNKYDYKNWALSVDGVDAAFVYPLRRGLGTVDIAITSNNNVPSDEIVRHCQAFIDDVRPVTAKEALVVKPNVTRIDFNIQVKLSGVSLLEIKQAITGALGDYFNTVIPADDFIVSQCEAIVSDLIGVVDRRFVSPTANRKADVVSRIEWFRLGNVTVSEMS